jgi:hypothetical protein
MSNTRSLVLTRTHYTTRTLCMHARYDHVAVTVCLFNVDDFMRARLLRTHRIEYVRV